ncbi:hypothetical protein P152DRAFT_474836 [Eremomyces bilateralis CBS 781.70]|uniref:Heterokaryon incompatibility domain-containing protein n=1 Tax=Eremomyces bilateralis CBS 781.70 TaxID=1392243 RepID=A0A6G1FZM5_9PEZI|nr:uncharacterized protein P152DRAFT_474836 [Eremomyces bilateralis CBS 781.70]KAF1811228.1 hypothetical protein P152DRAFT_474836 [Eremomyces bilateralis CBS 781.70]
MFTTGVLETIWDLIPKTIQDAIVLTKGLDERFLWVDAICLLQNDERDIQQGVNVMDSIFENALMTIIATNEPDADSGLPGVDGYNRFHRQLLEVIDNIAFVVHPMLDVLLSSSTYSKRAWTFQEDMFPVERLFSSTTNGFFAVKIPSCLKTCSMRSHDILF